MSCTVQVWTLAVQALLYVISPSDLNSRSIFDLSLQESGLASMALSYTGNISTLNVLMVESDDLGLSNTPANHSWELTLYTTNLNGVDPQSTYISFLPNQSIDTDLTSPTDLAFAKNILSGAENALLNRTTVSVDMLELVNWLFVSIYWTMLFDLGQLSPKIYDPPDPTSGADPISFSTTNNIFTNPTLFEIYYSYLNNTVLPILAEETNVSDADRQIPWFNPPSATNSLNALNTTFIRDYDCRRRQFKKPLQALASVILNDYALIKVPYAIAVWCAIAIQKRVRSRNCKFSFLNDAYFRESL